jgi:hypothetical protein
MGAYRIAWWILAVPLGSIGVAAAVASSSLPATIVIFGLMAACLGVLSAILHSLDGEGQVCRPISVSTVIRHGCAEGVAVVALYGMTGLIGPAAVPLILLLAFAHPTVVHRWRTGVGRHSAGRTTTDTRRAHPGLTSERTEYSTPDLEALTNVQLCMEWRRSFIALQRTADVAELVTITTFRQRLLDELERRNPEGFSDWLACARAPSNPARYLDHPAGRRHQQR